MIGYRISDKEMTELIVKHDAKWPRKAETATKACCTAGVFVDKGSLWTDIKSVLLRLQHEKCCYCERLLASSDFGMIEHDVEHFRPKSRVQDWFGQDVLADFPDWPSALPRSGASAKGYYKLAYNALNYATACKTCNSALKRDLFPVAGRMCVTGASPHALAAEKPFLIFPLGDWDDPPESLIKFEGITAVPVHPPQKDLQRHWRARVTIRFFRLNRSTVSAATRTGDKSGG